MSRKYNNSIVKPKNFFKGPVVSVDVNYRKASPNLQDLTINYLQNKINQKINNNYDFDSLLTDYQNEMDKIKVLENELSIAKGNLSNYKPESLNEIEKLEKENAILKEQVRKKKIENKDLYEKNNDIYIEIEDKNLENEGLKNYIEGQKNIINNIHKEMKDLEDQVIHLKGTVHKSNVDNLNTIKTEIDDLYSKSDYQENLLQNQKEKNNNLVKEIQEEKDKNDELFNEYNIKLNQENELQRQLDVAKDQLNKLMEEKNDLKNKINEVNDNITKVKNEFAIIGPETDDLQLKNEKLHILINERDNHIYDIVENNEELEKEIDLLKGQKNNLEKKQNGYKEYAGKITEANEKLQKELELIFDSYNEIENNGNGNNQRLIQTQIENEEFLKNL